MSIIPRNGVSTRASGSSSFELDHYQPNETDDSTPSFDFVGAILRRKFLVIIFAILGVTGGYFYFNSETPVYTSAMRLMIWVQAPPSVVNGELITQRVSIEKHQSLVVSESVLASAIKLGELDKPGKLSGAPLSVGQLKGMVRAVALDEGKSDSLMLTAQGTVPADLPVALQYVVEAYMAVIGEDSQEAGRESVELIEKLQQKLADDQRSDKERYETLIAQLNLTTENERGSWSNPFSKSLERLKEQKEKLTRQLRDTENQITQARAAIEVRTDRPDLVKLLAIQAKKYLQLQWNTGDPSQAQNAEVSRGMQRFADKIARYEDDIALLEADRVETLKLVGQNHPSVVSIDSSLQIKNTLLQKAQTDLEAFRSQLEAAPAPSAVNSEASDRELLQLYSAALVRDRETQKSELDQTTAELAAIEAFWTKVSPDIIELNILKAKIDERRNAISKLLDKLSTINLVTNNYNSTKVRIIDPPSYGYQTYPRMSNFLTIGGIIGALLGAGLALIIDRADMSFRTPLQIQELVRAPVVCQVPKIEKSKLPAGYKGSHCLVTHLKPLSNSAEAFRSGRAALMYTASQINGKVFLFTSPTPGDGKSTISSNFALSLAQLGKKVILVDADFRRPRVAQYLGEDPKPGFCDHLNGIPLEECIRTSTYHNNLSFLPTGGHPKNPGEIVIGNELNTLIHKLREQFDYVIIDSPPLNPVADSSALASMCDGVYMIIRIRRGGVVAASRARDQLDLVNAKLLGIIVNGLDNNPHYYDHGYYGYIYQRGYGKYYESSSKDLIDV